LLVFLFFFATMQAARQRQEAAFINVNRIPSMRLDRLQVCVIELDPDELNWLSSTRLAIFPSKPPQEQLPGKHRERETLGLLVGAQLECPYEELQSSQMVQPDGRHIPADMLVGGSVFFERLASLKRGHSTFFS
jgi:hypothetical protein